MTEEKNTSKFFNKKEKLFWQLLFLFWFIHWFTWLLIYPLNLEKFDAFMVHLLHYLAPFFLMILLRSIFKKYKIYQKTFLIMAIVVALSSVICGTIWVIFEQILVYLIHGHLSFTDISSPLFRQIWIESYAFFAWSPIYLGYKIYEEMILQKQKADEAALLAKNAQLEMLRYQLNPHFLFNTLNSARTLVQIDPPLAQEMLTQISEFLRYSLSEGKKSKVPLSKEMEAINTYLDIEKIRYKQNLIIEYYIDPKAEDFEIPVFLILPLIENAIKHGMKTTSLPLKIFVKAELIDNVLHIEIANTGRWIEQPQNNGIENTGTGLANVRKRLENWFADNYNFDIFKEENLIRVILEIKKVRQ